MAKPIIATNIDGITEQIIGEKNGILVSPKDYIGLAKAILKLITKSYLQKKSPFFKRLFAQISL